MMEIIAAGLVVSLTIIVTASRVHGKDTSILWASVLISVSMVLNINPVYLFADGWAGGRNHADLGANLLLLTGSHREEGSPAARRTRGRDLRLTRPACRSERVRSLVGRVLMKFLVRGNSGDVRVPCRSSPGTVPVSKVLIRFATM
ncbi:hypothetical protein SAMN04487914_1538 [Arthrobacter sp. ok909]|uniref:hypothetical protein n=1 Tax=Arthrobacter sp. ok909 TaxID=1761746 RepID=UPI000880423F|nr:hypothetical protein [Arthrobacter sp. ok909]SDP83719.1 hypothetical protein SAMN04487914_1538 [Arthrobacter sp. ok909]